MSSVWAFIGAASPWIAMGLLVVILCTRRAAEKSGKGKQNDDYAEEGMCIGMCLGTALGSTLGNNVGIGLTMGMLIGLVIGTLMPKGKKD